MCARLSDLLENARRKSFVGRTQEIGLFEEMAFTPRPVQYLLYIYGPGGQGKTTLIKRLKDSCEERQIPYLHLDGRDTEAHPVSLMEHLRNNLQLPPDGDPFEAIAQSEQRTILFIDTYEKLSPIDDWVRTDFLPQLPANVFTLICSRNAPSMNWQADPGWKLLMKTKQLRNFSSEESLTYLQQRQVPPDSIEAILDFTHGHPLALSVVADIFEQHPNRTFNPDESPDIVRALLELFLQQVPGPAHKSALEICAMARLTTESLLEEVMGLSSAGILFDWLRQLSFIENSKDGLFPHDLVRETLVADLRWRHPDWYAELHGKVRDFLIRKMRETVGEVQRKYLFELIYLHRTNPVVRPFFDWQESGTFWMDKLLPEDIPAIEAMITAQEGDESLQAFRFWAQQPATAQVWVWRDAQKHPAAFVLKLNLHEWPTDQPVGDPPVQILLDTYRRRLQLRSGEQWALFRMWMANDTHQQPSSLQSSIFLAIVQYYFSPSLAVSMLNVSYPEFWKQIMHYGDLQELPEFDFVTNQMPFGWYIHDWRKRPVLAWLDLVGKREIDMRAGAEPAPEPPQLQMMVLSEPDFENFVGEALKSYHNRDELSDNPLTRSRLVLSETGPNAPVADRIAQLKNKIDLALKEIEESPVDGKYHRILYRTFINPVGSQEKTADFLNMSFSTYRRYLKSGMERLAALLWREEVEG